MRSMSYDVSNNERHSRFETTVDGHTAFSAYRRSGDTITFTHTEVPQELEGRGIAGAIVKHALEEARAQKLGVVALCAYVASYIKRHPEYQDLLRG
jgi:predicted GNAT family acetyltransferase